tara:strand:- start:1557 stop:1661 length:105 start_codon:yes stop_codon:yes gene_type:complete
MRSRERCTCPEYVAELLWERLFDRDAESPMKIAF